MRPSRMITLSERRRLLVTEAALHRSSIALEQLALRQRAAEAQERLHANRWWLLAAAAGAGLLLLRQGRLLRWLPAAAAGLRLAAQFRTLR